MVFSLRYGILKYYLDELQRQGVNTFKDNVKKGTCKKYLGIVVIIENFKSQCDFSYVVHNFHSFEIR
jgi:hypothetical protein